MSFDTNGDYNRTTWKSGDKITAEKLNKIEEALETINENDKSRHEETDNRLDILEEKNKEIEKDISNLATKNEVSDLIEPVVPTLNSLQKNTLDSAVFGALGDNSTDDYNALHSLFIEAGKDVVYDTSLSSNRIFTKTINIKPGVYRVKQNNLFADAFVFRTGNLVINGNGATIVFEGDGSLFVNNDKALNVDIYNLNFIGANDDNKINRVLISSDSDGGAQAFRWHQCAFSGYFQYGVNLTGSNCNSEWVFNQCSFFGTWDSFLYIGNTDTSDQFLNYWFNNCKYWCSSNWITAYRGGHFKLNHCDVSGYQPSEDVYLFRLLNTSHSFGVTSFIDDGTRYELKSSGAKVIYCTWDNARISFENSDFSSNSFNNIERDDYFYFINNTNGGHSSYVFTNCNFIGRFRLRTANMATSMNIILTDCLLRNTLSATNLSDLFVIERGINSGAIFNIKLVRTKYSNKVYNCDLNPWVGEIKDLSVKATIHQSPYANLVPTWTYPVFRKTFIDEVIFMVNGYQQDGNTYRFSIKSDCDTISHRSSIAKTIHPTNQKLYEGQKFTIGDSNTVYTVTSVDYGLSGSEPHYVVVDKDIEDSVQAGDIISYNILDIVYQPNKSYKILTSSEKYVIDTPLYIKDTGSTTSMKATGYNAKIIVKTIE